MNLQTALATMPDSKTERSARLFEESLGDGFNLATFVDNFDVLLDSVGSAEHLKELVLQLAIRGRLAPQQRSDEPAATLLKRLGAERVSHRGTASKFDSPVEAPFPIPPTWAWTRLDKVWLAITDGDHQPPPKSVEGVAFLTIGNVSRGSLDFTSTRRVSESYFQSLDELRVPRPGDLLYTVVGSYGIPLLVNTKQPFCVQRHIAILKPLPSTDVAFMRWLMESRFIYGQARDGATGIAQPTVGLGVLRNFVVPLPPLAEQKRIVARVDQLIALVDDLEAKQTRKREVGTRFTTASLASLTTAEAPHEFDAAWKLVVENFPTVLDASTKVSEMRQAILVLAARGLLVRQEPSDASAEALVAQCPIRQSEAEAEGRFKRVERLPPPRDEERGNFPHSWACERLGNLCRFIDYRGKTPTKLSAGTRLITAKNVRMGFVNLEPQEFIAPKAYPGWMTRGLPTPGDLLFTTEAPLGNVALFDFNEPVALAQRIIALHPFCDIDSRFLMFVLMSPWFQTLLADKATGMTATGIKASKLKELVVPIAPLAEQKRIVAKVEHMMKLCDDLEAKLRRSEDRASKLVEAVVQEMVA